MKAKHYLILSGICFLLAINISTAFAQPPASLLRADNLWSILKHEEDRNVGFPGFRPTYKKSFWLKTGKDTLINGKKYVFLSRSTDANHSIWEDMTYDDAYNSRYLLREENGKIHIYFGDPGDILLYDFNLKEGEYMTHHFDWMLNGSLIFSVVDSIRYVRIDNVARKKFYISEHFGQIGPGPGSYQETWIEGIGSSLGLLRQSSHFYIPGGIFWNLLCFYRNDRLLYQSPDFSDCYYRWVSGNPKVDSKLDFQLYPNPSAGKFTIRFAAENGNSQIQIFDVAGKLIRSLQPDNYSGSLEVDLSDVPPRTYLIRLSKSGFSGTKKIVIR